MKDIVLNYVLSLIEKGLPAVLVSLVDTAGSVPRKKGSRMYVSESGIITGSIGGGNLENYCIGQAVDVYKTKKTYTADFNLSGSAEKSPVSMICGGDVSVEFRYLTSADVSFLQGEIQKCEKKPAVYIFGAGHVGKALCPVLSKVGFDVYMADDRPEFADRKVHPTAADCILCDFSDIKKSVSMKESDYAVVMTHGHIADREVLLQVCRTQKAYIGCIGSRKKVEATQEYLRQNGIGNEIISLLHMPIGLPIGGDTPEEIAISVTAEILKFYYRENFKTNFL